MCRRLFSVADLADRAAPLESVSQEGKRDFVSQSTSVQPKNRIALLQRSGEFSDFADVLSKLSVPTDEYVGAFPAYSELDETCLAIVSGRRLLQAGTPDLRRWPRTFAVIDDSSKTLVSQLNRIGVTMVIRRPIHPRALRLLLLHEIYRGPERRDRKRVLIGHPIRIGSGLFKSPATLLELSPTGARIEMASAPKVGSKLKILFGKDLTNGRTIKLRAKVVRSIRASEEKGRSRGEVGVLILDSSVHAKVLNSILNSFKRGPASMPTQIGYDRPQMESPQVSKREIQGEGNSTNLPPVHVSPRHVATPPPARKMPPEKKSETASSQTNADRRLGQRIPYDHRVVALSEEAARVLVGRDLSVSGMRIAATPSVAVGDILRVALHNGIETEPLLVLAHAMRDDGDDGLILSFKDISENQRSRLEGLITERLPIQSGRRDGRNNSESPESLVVAEVVETVDRESDQEIERHLDSIFDPTDSAEEATHADSTYST